MRRMRTWGMVAAILILAAGWSGAAGAEKPESWGPQFGPSNPRGLDRSKLSGVVGPRGEMVRCGGNPLLIDPLVGPPQPPWGHRVKIWAGIGDRMVVAGPSFAPRCAGRGTVAWYVWEEDPLRPGSRAGSPISLSLPVPWVRVKGSEIEDLVWNGGCASASGEVPPCVPGEPLPVFRAKSFRTFKPTLLNLRARVKVDSTWVHNATSGSARVKVQLEVDGDLLGAGDTFTLPGDERRVLRSDRRFLLPPGRHRIGLKLEGTGYDFVNVAGESAHVQAFLTKTFRR